ncbi:MAG: ATP-binding protein [Methyloceanibacter sp.]|nr:ATP-binding protein [Methyloceanibacter sp.]
MTVSVVLGIGLTVSIFIFLYSPNMPKDGPPLVAAQIATFMQLVQEMPSTKERAALVNAAVASGVAVAKVSREVLQPLPAGLNKGLSWGLTERQLSRYDAVDVIDGMWFPAGPREQVVLALDRENALIFEPAPRSSIWHLLLTPAALAIVIVLIFLLLVSVYAVRWFTAPLSAVASATRSFGESPADMQEVTREGPREIRQLADALNDMRDRIRGLLDDRTRMLTAISHDLRTPLTRLRLRSELVEDFGLREAMLGDIERVNRMLEETLEVMRGTEKAEEVAQVDLPSMIQTICSDFSDVGLDVCYEGPDRLAWPVRASAMSRALTNIVENGVKYGGSALVTLRTKDSVAEIDISDDGPGIPESLRAKVFEPFFKVDDSRSSTDGFGLGLSLAREIVRRHGGDIRLRHRTPNGVIVRITLPCASTN